MTAGPTAGAENPAPGVADGSLASALSTVDTQATQRLTTLGLVYQARQSRLIRSAASITAQQGSGSAQATAAEAAVATAKMTAARLAVVQQQVTTAAPTVAASGWALHGRVYTAQLESAVGYCVFLVDAQNAYYSPTGFAYTDSTGYFQLMYPGTATQPTPVRRSPTLPLSRPHSTWRSRTRMASRSTSAPQRWRRRWARRHTKASHCPQADNP